MKNNFLTNKDFSKLNFKSDSLDKLKITGFSPNEMTFQTRTKKSQSS